MTALQNFWRFISAGFEAAQMPGRTRAAARNEAAALRLYSLPRGIRQSAKHCPLHV